MMMNILNKVQLPQESVTTGDHKAFSCKENHIMKIWFYFLFIYLL